MLSDELALSLVQAGAEAIHDHWNYYDPEYIDDFYGDTGYPRRQYVYSVADRQREILDKDGHLRPVEEIVAENQKEPWNFVASVLEALSCEKMASEKGTLHVRQSFGGAEQGPNAGMIVQLEGDSQCYALNGHWDSWNGISYNYTRVLPVEPRLKVVWVSDSMPVGVYSKPTEKERAYLEEEMPWLNREES